VPDIETRIKALEMRARANDERWQMLEGQMKGISLIFDSLGIALAAMNSSILRAIIQNLRTFEDTSRQMNAHAATISQLHYAREFFEGRLSKIAGGGSIPLDGSGPPRQR
jgi:hypothetical protein